MDDRRGIVVPQNWVEAIEALLGVSAPRVLLLGPRDAGKSTFARALLEAAADRGVSVALLDTDVGQKAVGPPACVTLGILCAGALKLLGLAFVGATDPVRGWRGVIAGATRLGAEAPVGLLAVNTSGLLGGPGRRLKAAKITALRPDIIVAIGSDTNLDAILADHAGTPTVRLAPSPRALRKTEGWCRAARREAFRAYFQDAEERTAPLAPIPPETLPARGTLLGLAGADGRDLALGLVSGADPAAGTLAYRAPPLRDRRVAEIHPSTLILRDDYSEARG